MYIDTLHCLRNAVGRKRSEKMENQRLVSLSLQYSSTLVVFGQGFLSKEQCDNTGTFPVFYLPDFSWFLPASRLNKNWRDFAVVMIVTSFRMRRNIWKGFQKMASKNVSKIFSVVGSSVQLHKRTISSERKRLEATIYKCLYVLFTEQSQNWNIILEGSEM